MRGEDRHLRLIRCNWFYVRRVPKSASALDDRKVITTTLNTKDIYIARIRRDAMEDADNLF